ncbi:MAG TPA: hypothetical protein VFJ52_12115 [Terriglobia bacterium]|nr:hypothetical protein [Terriglobia bacterium]
MARPKTSSLPDTHVLNRLLEEYSEMLGETQRLVKKILSLDPHREEYWDTLSEHAAEISMLGIRSGSIVEEIDELIDQLPDD